MRLTHSPKSLAGFAFAAALLVATTAPVLDAQVVRGLIVKRDSIPVAGATVTLLDATNVATGATVSDEFGAYEVRAPRAGTWRLQVEAVGFKRVVSLPITLAAGEALQRRIHLVDATARLATLRVTDRTRCDVSPAEGTIVATLWDEARKALAAANATNASSPLFSLDHDEIEYDSTFQRAHAATRSTTTGRVAQVFRSAPPASLRALGYVRVIDSTTVYFGPDARALLSNEFAATHCFSLAGDDPTSIRRVGLAFTPVGRPRGLIDVAGTLWLDRDSYELDRVDFRFAPSLSEAHEDTTFGGSVRFTRAPGGQVIVQRWTLRMPVFGAEQERRVAPEGATSRMVVRAAPREVVVGMRVERGMTRLDGERPLPLPEVVARRGRYVGPNCDADSLAKRREGGIEGLIRDEGGKTVANLTLRASWTRPDYRVGRIAFREEWIETASDQRGRYAICGLPSGIRVQVVARARGGVRLRTSLVAPDSVLGGHDLTAAGRDIVVLPTAEGVLRGRVVARGGLPIPRAQVMLLSGTARVATDSTGHFTLAPLPPRVHDLFVRRVGYAPVMASVAVGPADSVYIEIPVDPTAQALAAVTIEARVTTPSLAGFELRRQQKFGSGIYIGGEELDRRRASPVLNVLRSAGRVNIEESQATGDARAYGRGGANPGADDRCPLRIVIDGVVMAEGSPLNVLPPVSEIAGIEIYTSSVSVPAQFNYGIQKCGIIVVWTKDGTTPDPVAPLREPIRSAALPPAPRRGRSRSRRRRARRS